jgi:hypothetical protein
MRERQPLIIRPFGKIGSRYQVTPRGLFLHHLSLWFTFAAVVGCIAVFWILNSAFNAEFFGIVAVYFTIREFLLAFILKEATRLE